MQLPASGLKKVKGNYIIDHPRDHPKLGPPLRILDPTAPPKSCHDEFKQNDDPLGVKRGTWGNPMEKWRCFLWENHLKNGSMAMTQEPKLEVPIPYR
jgi:hypothetical protein